MANEIIIIIFILIISQPIIMFFVAVGYYLYGLSVTVCLFCTRSTKSSSGYILMNFRFDRLWANLKTNQFSEILSRGVNFLTHYMILTRDTEWQNLAHNTSGGEKGLQGVDHTAQSKGRALEGQISSLNLRSYPLTYSKKMAGQESLHTIWLYSKSPRVCPSFKHHKNL